MKNNNKIVIKDSCILFDLIDLQLTDYFFELDIYVNTTQHVIEEITDKAQQIEINKYITNGKLIVDSKGSFESIQTIFNDCKGLSLADCSVLELTIRLNGIILSSDKSLRNESEKRKFTVHGILWIIEKLCDKNIITREVAINKLEIYPKINDRAPKIEIESLIKTLKQEPLIS